MAREKTGHNAIWTELSSFFRHYFVRLMFRLDEHHVFLSGGGIAFSLFCCIIPFTLILFAVLGNVLDTVSVEHQVTSFIDTLIPYPQYSTYAKKIILSRIPEVVQYKNLAGYIGSLGLIFTASGLFSSLRTTLNKVFGVTEDKTIIMGKLRDFGMVFVLIIFVLFSTIILPLINILINVAYQSEILKAFRVGILLNILISFFSIFVIFLMFFFFYYAIPYEKLGRKVPAFAAFWATLLWELAGRLFGYYIQHFATITMIYGTYALIVVLAFWIYYSSILFLLGAELGQLFRERLEQKNKKN